MLLRQRSRIDVREPNVDAGRHAGPVETASGGDVGSLATEPERQFEAAANPAEVSRQGQVSLFGGPFPTEQLIVEPNIGVDHPDTC